MKKLFTFLSVAAVVLMLVSCGSRTDYRHMIPSDSFMVISANPKAIGTKAEIGDFTQSSIYGHIQTALADCNTLTPETREYILSLVAEPSKSGLSMDHDCFMFIKGQNIQSGLFDTGVIFKVHDRAALDKLTDLMLEKDEDLERVEENGISMINLGRYEPSIAYNNHAAIMYFSTSGTDTATAIKGLFAQKKENSIMNNSNIAAVINANNDMNLVMSYASLMPMINQMGMGTGFEWMGKMVVAAPVNFEKGAIVSDMKVLFDDKEAEKQFMEYASVYGKMSGDLVKYLPAGTIGAMGTAMKGANVYQMLNKIPMYSMVLSMAPQAQPIMGAIDGDLVISFNRMSDDGRYPLVTLAANINDQSVVTTIRDLAVTSGITMTEVAPGDYQGNMQGIQFWFGHKDNVLYISTDGGFVANLRTGSTDASFHDAYGQLFNNTLGAFAMNIDELRGMLLTMMANNSISSEVAMAMPYIALFKDVQSHANELTEANVTINMTDRDANAAKTLYTAIQGLVNMAVGGHDCCGECCDGE